jgi:hypothetical protein
MLTPGKKAKMFAALKEYRKKFLDNKYAELDESGTRLMINSFLTDVLGYASIEEIKTEYMIRGTYADYVIQIKGTRHFLVEVKALSLALSDKHLRQAINYGANEGIEWALLTNGKCFEFYKILFDKPIEAKKVISIDLSDSDQFKESSDILQYLHKDSLLNKGLEFLWNKHVALEPVNIAGILYTQPVINIIKKHLKIKYKDKFSDEEIISSLNRIAFETIQLENIKHVKIKKEKKKISENCNESSKVELPNEIIIEQPVSKNDCVGENELNN